MMDSYQYQELPPLRDAYSRPYFTRLMILHPGNHSDPVGCTMEIVDIEKTDPFEALSYVWGRETASNAILCDNASLSITLNLDQALRHLRRTDRIRRLWVDAVCINQSSVDERSRQVAYMRMVYKSASCVVVWIGLRVHGVEQAFKSAGSFARLLNDRLCKGSEIDLIKGFAQIASKLKLEAADHLVLLFRREYFERVWCIQEVVASRWCIAKCEALEMDFMDLLSTAWPVLARIRNSENAVMRAPVLQFWSSVFFERLVPHAHKIEGSMGQLDRLFQSVRYFKSTDQRDKLYAILGISGEGLAHMRTVEAIHNSTVVNPVRRGIKWICKKFETPGLDAYLTTHSALTPNYKKSVKEVYRDITRCLMLRWPHLDILSHVDHTGDPSQESFPSWVPKLFEARPTLPLGLEWFYSGIIPRTRHDIFPILDNPIFGKPRKPDSLHVQGFRVDQVEAVTDVITYDPNMPFQVESIWIQLFDFPSFPRPGRRYAVNAEALDLAFFMTMIIGSRGGLQSAALDPEGLGKMVEEKIVDDAALDLCARYALANLAAWLCEHPSVRKDSYPEFMDLPVGTATQFATEFCSSCKNRRFYRTSLGFLGVGPAMMRPGDEVCVLLGGRLPFVLRPRGDHFVFIGSTYLHHDSILRGKEIIAVKSKRRNTRIKTFELR